MLTTRVWTLESLLAAVGLLAACSRPPVVDPDRARCKQQLESFYQLTRASDFLDRGYGDRAFDAVIALAAQVTASKDTYCALVREKAVEVEQQRAQLAKNAAEVQAAIALLRTEPRKPAQQPASAPVTRTPDAGDVATSSAVDAARRRDAARDARAADTAPPAPAAGAAKTYCQFTLFVNGQLTKQWTCLPQAPSEAQAACEAMLKQKGIENPSCYCTTDPAYVAGKCD